MAKYSIEGTTLTNIANAIRSKTNKTDSITVSDMANEISEISAGGNMQSKTVTPTTSTQTVAADSGYDGLSTVTVNAMPTATQATPSISVSSSGLITASTTQSAGYVSAGTKSATKQLSTQAAKTVMPTTSSQTAVESGKYTTGTVTVAAVRTETKTITANGTYTPTSGKFFSSVSVNVAGGGGSVETCTVTVNNTSGKSCRLIYSSAGIGHATDINNNTSKVLENLVLNGMVCLKVFASNFTRQTNGFSDAFNAIVDGDGVNFFYVVQSTNAHITISAGSDLSEPF